MDAYEKFSNCPDIGQMLDNINGLMQPKGMYSACHGRYHAMYVVSVVENILQSLSYDARTVELGKIAALLHDIGNIAGRWNHARKSAALASVLLDYPIHFSQEEKTMVIQAIEDHSAGKHVSSAVGAAVFIADKADITKRRILPSENIDPFHKNLMEIEDVEITVSGNAITINYITSDSFCRDTLSEYLKKFEMSAKAAAYLGCTYHLQFNGVEEKIAI